MKDPRPEAIGPSPLRDAMARRLYRRAVASGQVTLPAVPSMLDEYVRMCDNIFADLGVRFTADELARLRTALQGELAQAYAASSRSTIVIAYDCPVGRRVNYHVRAEWCSIEASYDNWLATRQPPLFGSEPDARVWALAGETADPQTFRVLDIGAGTGRNTLALARRGHPVDAVEMAPKFAEIIRAEARRESLDVRVIQRDVFASTDELCADYRLIVASEVVPDFRTTEQLGGLFELAARCLAPGGKLVFNTFLTSRDYTPDSAARELGQQCYSMMFTRGEMISATALLPLDLVADHSVYEYEKAHLPQGAWPPTGWYADWASGLDVFDVEPAACPIELRWLVYQRRTGQEPSRPRA